MATLRDQPLIYRLVSRIPDSGASRSEAHARIIREIRRYNASSIAEAALRVIWATYPTNLDQLQMAPWHVLLIVKWALQDSNVALRVGPSISSDAFDRLRQAVQDLLGVEHQQNRPQNIFLMMRAHLQQVDFQRSPGWGFLRWPALIARQPVTQPTHRQFVEILGLPPSHFIDLSFGLFAVVLSKELPVSNGWLDPMRATYGKSIDSMWQLVSRDLASLRDELRHDEARRLPVRQELYEFPYLKRFPLVRMRDQLHYCWHPMVYVRGLEDLVHLKLSGLRHEYTEPFSRLFESYVIELTKAMHGAAIDEEEYRRQVGGRPNSVEAAASFGSCNIFVEAKMSLFGDDVLLTDNEAQAYQKTKRLREGIKQAWTVGQAVRQPESPFRSFATATHDFLLLVTSRELYVGDGSMLQRLYRAGEFDYPDEAARARLPLQHVFVLSIETFERLSCAVAAGDVTLPVLLSEAAARSHDPSTSSILFDGYLDKYVKRRRLPELLESAKNAAQARVAVALGKSSDVFQTNLVSGDA